jgi:site-specific DNA-methyltransferase (adenine-specific)
VTIYHGDCREWLPEADAIVTDPPYGMNLGTDNTSRGGRRFAPIVGDDAPFDPAPILALRKPTILFGANYYASRLPDSGSWVVWDKRDGVLRNTNADAELIWTNLGGPVRTIRHVWAGMLRDSQRREPTLHPTEKPVAVMRDLILRTSGTVLDPYMGSGATLVAAKSLGRRSIGVEIEERYCEVAANRCRQETLGLTA